MAFFEIVSQCPETRARTGTLNTPHGSVSTPVFMPLATQGSVKTLSPDDLKDVGAEVIVGNTYHLYLRPGSQIVKQLGGLHKFMAWDGPMLTDSGGFQVFSLAHLREITDEGVRFQSHIDGSEHFLTPELAIDIQEELGADIIICFDECVAYTEDVSLMSEAMHRTHVWAERCLNRHRREDQLLFGIVQGGTSPELRRESAKHLVSLDFPGYAIGSLSVGEPKNLMYSVARETAALLPEEKPRYLMGVGSPEDLLKCVSYGIDMFDCALPTRIARNGAFLTRNGRLNISNARFKDQSDSVDPYCNCYTCRTFAAAYLHHLFKCEELLAYRLATIHNLHFVLNLMKEIRFAIREGNFAGFKKNFLANYQPVDEETRIEQKRKWTRSQREKSRNDFT